MNGGEMPVAQLIEPRSWIAAIVGDAAAVQAALTAAGTAPSVAGRVSSGAEPPEDDAPADEPADDGTDTEPADEAGGIEAPMAPADPPVEPAGVLDPPQPAVTARASAAPRARDERRTEAAIGTSFRMCADTTALWRMEMTI
ncbi:hypothetical protein GCM10009818_18430 [Nakamurella flavida]